MRFMQFLKVQVVIFQPLFTELQYLFSLSRYGTANMVGFQNYIGICIGIKIFIFFQLKNYEKEYLEASRRLGKLKMGMWLAKTVI